MVSKKTIFLEDSLFCTNVLIAKIVEGIIKIIGSSFVFLWVQNVKFGHIPSNKLVLHPSILF